MATSTELTAQGDDVAAGRAATREAGPTWQPIGIGFPPRSETLESFGLKFSPGGPHLSRTMMLAELDATLAVVPPDGAADDYRAAIIGRNILGKATESTRKESVRRLRELYALSEPTPIFGLLRKLHAIDASSLPLLAVQVAWSRDPMFRATTPPVLDADEGERVETVSLAAAVYNAFQNQYSINSRNQTARHAASSWTQSGHLVGRAKKRRQRVKPAPVAATMALFLGDVAGFHGVAVFSSPWCRLLDLDADRARSMALEAHRAGLLNLRIVGEIVDISFPLLTEFRGAAA